MPKEVRLPQLGQTMEEGTITRFVVGVGAKVSKGDVIFEIETDKANLEVESPADGYVKKILAEEGQTLSVGDVVLVLGAEKEEISQSFLNSLGMKQPAAELSPETETAAKAEPEKEQPQIVETPERIMASPRAKKLAKDMGVDLSAIMGTGPGGKITEQDVENAAAKKPKTEPPTGSGAKSPAGEIKLGSNVPVNRMQRITAEKMAKSKSEIPCFYVTVKADVTELVKLRTNMNQNSNVRVSYNDFIMRAVATGLEKFPIMTGQYAKDTIQLPAKINVGLAIAAPEGLVAPVVKDVNKKTVVQIARESNDLVKKAQSSTLSLDELEGACTTVSNLGGFGADSFIPIVIPGQTTIIGVGRITDTVVPVACSAERYAGSQSRENGFTVRKLMSLTLSVDHRVTNGAYATQFIDFVKIVLEEANF